MKCSPIPTTRVEIVVGAHLDGVNKQKALRWLNTQHDKQKRETIPLKEKCSEEHKTACWKLLMCRRFTLTIEIDKNGEWKLIPSNYNEPKSK